MFRPLYNGAKQNDKREIQAIKEFSIFLDMQQNILDNQPIDLSDFSIQNLDKRQKYVNIATEHLFKKIKHFLNVIERLPWEKKRHIVDDHEVGIAGIHSTQKIIIYTSWEQISLMRISQYKAEKIAKKYPIMFRMETAKQSKYIVSELDKHFDNWLIGNIEELELNLKPLDISSFLEVLMMMLKIEEDKG